MVARRFHALPVLILLLLAAGCAGSPPVRMVGAAEVAVVPGDSTTWVVRGRQAYALQSLDVTRVVRMYRVFFDDGVADEAEEAGEWILGTDGPESAAAFMEAARWVDGLVLSRRGLREDIGLPSPSSAGIVAETYRRFLMVDPPAPPPQWAEMIRVLSREGVWEASPHHAAMGALLYAAVVLSGHESKEARNQAVSLLARAVAEHRVPTWLSWIAYRKWTAMDLDAKDDTGSAPMPDASK